MEGTLNIQIVYATRDDVSHKFSYYFITINAALITFKSLSSLCSFLDIAITISHLTNFSNRTYKKNKELSNQKYFLADSALQCIILTLDNSLIRTMLILWLYIKECAYLYSSVHGNNSPTIAFSNWNTYF